MIYFLIDLFIYLFYLYYYCIFIFDRLFDSLYTTNQNEAQLFDKINSQQPVPFSRNKEWETESILSDISDINNTNNNNHNHHTIVSANNNTHVNNNNVNNTRGVFPLLTGNNDHNINRNYKNQNAAAVDGDDDNTQFKNNSNNKDSNNNNNNNIQLNQYSHNLNDIHSHQNYYNKNIIDQVYQPKEFPIKEVSSSVGNVNNNTDNADSYDNNKNNNNNNQSNIEKKISSYHEEDSMKRTTSLESFNLNVSLTSQSKLLISNGDIQSGADINDYSWLEDVAELAVYPSIFIPLDVSHDSLR